jgi:hypothetical protein
MRDSALVCSSQTTQDAKARLDDLASRHRSRLDTLTQRSAVQQFGNDIRNPSIRADVVQRDDVRVIERGCRARLLLEARNAIGIGRRDFRQDFDRDVTVQSAVAGPIDFAHPPRTKEARDLVWTELRPGSDRHLIGILIAVEAANAGSSALAQPPMIKCESPNSCHR